MADPRVILSAALLSGASAMVLAHNHPSGSSEPSEADTTSTRQIAQGAKLLGIKLLDHLVVARGGEYTSFRLRNFPSLEGR
jgi:DNA repair protein RadC